MASRKGYCIVSVSPVRVEKKDSSEMVTQLLFGELVSVEELTTPWCKIQTFSDNYEGFVDSKHIHFLSDKEVSRWLDGLSYQTQLIRTIECPWGKQLIYRGSYVNAGTAKNFNIGNDHFTFLEDVVEEQFRNPVDLALEYINAPYLWGGKTPFGIDCSGLTQTVYRFFDLNLPRDASQQIDCGTSVTFDEQLSGDIAFFNNSDGNIIHVGILDGMGHIIHASGAVRKDTFTQEGIFHSETGYQSHTLHSIRRL
jgi:hypothetical protein